MGVSPAHGQLWSGCPHLLRSVGQSQVPQGGFHSHQCSEQRPPQEKGVSILKRMRNPVPVSDLWLQVG